MTEETTEETDLGAEEPAALGLVRIHTTYRRWYSLAPATSAPPAPSAATATGSLTAPVATPRWVPVGSGLYNE